MKIEEGYWFNYKTGEYEYIATPTDFTNYIPQHEAALALYSVYQEARGMSPVEATIEVLKICVNTDKK